MANKFRTNYLYLHHQQQRVENNKHHDEIFEWCRHDDSPDFVFETIPFAGHIALQWSCTDSKINTGFLWEENNNYPNVWNKLKTYNRTRLWFRKLYKSRSAANALTPNMRMRH